MTSEGPEKPGEGFAGRWSRLKAEARAKPDVAEKPETPVADEPLEAAKPAPVVVESPAPLAQSEEEREVPLEELPRIEEIDASTDLTPWLKKKVPQAWRLAALRKTWSADPAIAGFIGPSDYAWNFNEPDSIPGFGTMRALDDIAKLVAQATGVSEPRAEADAVASEAAADDVDSMRALAEEEPAKRAASIPAAKEEQVAGEDTNTREEPETAVFSPRRGGGALPA